jgi:hypothetical protein
MINYLRSLFFKQETHDPSKVKNALQETLDAYEINDTIHVNSIEILNVIIELNVVVSKLRYIEPGIVLDHQLPFQIQMAKLNTSKGVVCCYLQEINKEHVKAIYQKHIVVIEKNDITLKAPAFHDRPNKRLGRFADDVSVSDSRVYELTDDTPLLVEQIRLHFPNIVYFKKTFDIVRNYNLDKDSFLKELEIAYFYYNSMKTTSTKDVS